MLSGTERQYTAMMLYSCPKDPTQTIPGATRFGPSPSLGAICFGPTKLILGPSASALAPALTQTPWGSGRFGLEAHQQQSFSLIYSCPKGPTQSSQRLPSLVQGEFLTSKVPVLVSCCSTSSQNRQTDLQLKENETNHNKCLSEQPGTET